MALKYDYDIQWQFPRESLADKRIGQMLDDGGLRPDMRPNYLALFRDPATAEALKGASEPVRKLFRASGFGFTCYQSGAADGTYPAEDEPAHVDVIGRLTENLQGLSLVAEDLNGFDFEAFVDHILAARPTELDEAIPSPPVPAPSRRVAEAAVLLAFTVLIAVFAGGILKVVGLVTTFATTMS